MIMTTMKLKEHYKTAMSQRDYHYFDTYMREDQDRVIEEARKGLHDNNVKKLKECVSAGNATHLLGVVSHELRTPLHAVVGILDLMQSDTMTEDQRLYMKSLEQSCASLHTVMNRLQDLAALLHGQAAIHSIPFDIVAVITGVAESMQQFSGGSGGGSHVTLSLDPSLPLSVNGDVTKVQQVITNLVRIAVTSSAEKHARLGADLMVDGPVTLVRIIINSISTQASPGLLDGIGLEFIPEDMFRPTSENNMYQGLVISREFVKMLGSKLETTWQENGSLQFSFDLQLARTAQAGPDNQSNSGDLVTARHSVKIMLVEDNQVNMQITKTMLKRMGFDPDTAENGLEAVSKLHQTSYDIVLMDCDMPLCNGYDATQHIRTKMKNNTVIIIALTADNTNAAKNRCLSVGMNDYFTKPITTRTLFEMLNKWLKTTPQTEGTSSR